MNFAAVIILLAAGLIALAVHKGWFAQRAARPHPTFDDVLDGLAVNESLSDHSREFDTPTVYKVTDGVYSAVGYALANSIMLEAPDGLIIVDTTESPFTAAAILHDFRQYSDKPIKAIIYTHNHPDHVVGTRAFIEDENVVPDIWGHHTLTSRFHETIISGPRITWGSDRQFGNKLKDYLINSGIGPRLSVHTERLPIPPTKLVVNEVQHETIAGLNITFLHVPGETGDHIAVWVPSKKVLMPGDNIYKTFPNLYAIRGTPTRDPLLWYESLRKMRALNAAFLVPSHTRPVEGVTQIHDLLSIYMAGIEFIHDQTVRLFNQGLHPDEIAQRVKLPAAIRSHRYWREHYGRVEWAVKAVYARYLGWFSGDVVELMPLSPTARSARTVALVGASNLLAASRAALEAGDLQWALELATHVWRGDPTDSLALEARVDALRALGAREHNPLGRNFYLTTALTDTGNLKQTMDLRLIIQDSPVELIFELMKRKLKAEVVEGLDCCIGFNFTDLHKLFKLSIRNSVLHIRNSTLEAEAAAFAQRRSKGASQESPDDSLRLESCVAVVTTDVLTWKELLVSQPTPAIRARLQITGPGEVSEAMAALSTFLSSFDKRQHV